MPERDVTETKLDILINDFQRFREEMKDEMEKVKEHAVEEDKVQAATKDTVSWHSKIGYFFIGVSIIFAVYIDKRVDYAIKVIESIAQKEAIIERYKGISQ